MAVPASFDESESVLGKPANMSDCDPLSISRRIVSDHAVVVSCWKFTPQEMEEITRTGRIWIGVVGVTMPPIVVAGHKADLIQPDNQLKIPPVKR